jgi:hypothetical protein
MDLYSARRRITTPVGVLQYLGVHLVRSVDIWFWDGQFDSDSTFRATVIEQHYCTYVE